MAEYRTTDIFGRNASSNVNSNGPRDGDVWSASNGGWDYSRGDGLGHYVAPGSVFSNGAWVSSLTAQANNLAARKIGYESQNAGLQNQLLQGQIQSQGVSNQVASTAGGRLNQLLQDPSSIASDPGYQFQYNQGLEAINRTAAAKGMLGSGNRLLDLTNYGQDRAKTSYGDSINRLSNLLSSNSTYSGSSQNKNQYQTNPNGSISLSGSY